VGFNRLDFPHLPIKTSFGAKEVHSEISSPPISNPGNYFVSFLHSLVLSTS
jgi:glutamine phosphoribosylpyrophosphate amidotransferase